MLLQRNCDVHGESANDKCRNHNGDSNDVEGLHQYVEVIAHHRNTSIHQAGENIGIDFGLFVALVVLDHDVVQQLDFLDWEADFGGIQFEFLQQSGVRSNRTQIVDKAFLQGEQIEQVTIFHGLGDLLLQVIGDRGNNLEMLTIMQDGAIDEPQDHLCR